MVSYEFIQELIDYISDIYRRIDYIINQLERIDLIV
jgi:hypothetical protein